MASEIDADIKQQILDNFEGCSSDEFQYPISVNGVDGWVYLEPSSDQAWGIRFLSEFGLTLNGEWAALCEAQGHLEIPELEKLQDHHEEDETPESSIKRNTFYGFCLRRLGIEGTIRFFAAFDAIRSDFKVTFKFREFIPFSMILNSTCLQPNVNAEDLALRFPTGQMIFE